MSGRLAERGLWTDLQLVEQLGPHLDQRLGEMTVRDLLIQSLVKIRPKVGWVRFLNGCGF